MSYSLHTLHNPTDTSRPPARSGISRFAHEIALVLGLVALVFWVLALLTHSAQDAAFSTSGHGGPVRNWGGRLGAVLSDLSYFLAGFSVWWCVAAGVRAWFSSLAQWLRADVDVTPARSAGRQRLVFWIGLVLLVSASAALEWSRLYRLEPRLPDHAGGALGYLVGPAAVKWLGFTGSGLLGIVVVVAAMAVVFRFSWGQVAERIGARIDGFFESRREQREMAEDLALGQQAAREREEIVLEERSENQESHATPGADRAGPG